jgi:NAD(P)-dependent dehydrogenase (short-subunit alcohol dehydrogenase family)
MSNAFLSSSRVFSRFRLDGRVVFLSGATGHLGQTMAEALGEAGAHVVLNARSQSALEILAEKLVDQGYDASVACFDVTDEKAARQHIVRIGEEYGRLDILVNNASSGRTGTMESATANDFDQLYRVNVTAPFQILQAAISLLKASSSKTPGGSSVINIASMYGSVSPDPAIYGTSGANNPPYYGAAKAGLIQLTRYAACHLANSRIRVNCISPGPFPSAKYINQDAQFRERLNAKNPMHRTGEPHELQGPLLFLASDASSYVTGINLPVDGGWTAW